MIFVGRVDWAGDAIHRQISAALAERHIKGCQLMHMNVLPPQELLARILEYHPDSGTLTWKHRTPDTFAATANNAHGGVVSVCNRFNSRFAGGPAFAHKDGEGRFCGKINKGRFSAHRVIWKLVMGSEPNIIDHIDGNPLNNRIENLRSVDLATNSRNLRLKTTRPLLGIQRDEKTGMWVVMIGGGKNRLHLGRYDTLSEAVRCRDAARAELGYHPQHGMTRTGGASV